MARRIPDPGGIALVRDIAGNGAAPAPGHELAQEICKRLAPSKVTLIGISGYEQPQDREAALKAGFDEHLVKPLESDQLVDLLAEFSASRE